MVHAQDLVLPNAYAHNDYWHKHPLFDALGNGYTHFEADIFLNNNRLVVAHVIPFWKKKRTLENLYFKPLASCIANNKISNDRPVTLMIDIKTGADKTYEALLPLLEKYRKFLSVYENGTVTRRAVTVVLTGNKPVKTLSAQARRLVFIDEDLKLLTKTSLSNNMALIASCRYSSLLSWDGQGYMPAHEKQRLKWYVNAAHQQGKKVRLWASPENTTVWRELLLCGVDLINTDQLVALKNFLLSNRTISLPEPPPTIALSTLAK